MSDFYPNTRGAAVVTFLRLACSVVLWRGKDIADKYHWYVFTIIQPHWVCPRSRRVCFPSLHCSDSRLLCWELFDAGPGLHTFPRSKPLRFRYLGTPQRHRLSWACVLHASQARAAQVTRFLARIVAPSWRLRLIPLPTSGSGCPHLPVSRGEWAGLQPASSAQSFVLWVCLAVVRAFFRDRYPTVWVAISS